MTTMQQAYYIPGKIFAQISDPKDGRVTVFWSNPKMNPDENSYPAEDFEILKVPGRKS